MIGMRNKHLLRIFSLFILFVSFINTVYAQNRTVTGTVSDQQGMGIPGVTVTVRGTNRATQTAANGSFTIEAPENGTLVFSAVGYGTQEMSVSGIPSTITLQTLTTSLNEVVVTGYGTARRRDVTGAVSSVRAKDFNKGVQVSPDQLIQGKAAGVLVINNSGQPGGATTVRIRGTSSIRSGNQPLYVIDGVPIAGESARPGGGGAGIGGSPGANPLNFINPNDIASIDVLKDASATAIFGSRGANGVILITTKRGQTGTPTVEASLTNGISNVMKRLEVLNAGEYRAALKNYGLTGGDFGADVDAFDAITRTAYTQNYNAAINGGNESGRYRLSISALDQEGIVRESALKKYTANLTSNFKLLNNKKLNIDFNLIAGNTTEDIAPISNNAGFTGSLIGQALQWNPTHPLRGGANDTIIVNNQIGNTTINPLAMLAAHQDRANTTNIIANIAPSYNFTDQLSYKLQFSINHGQGVRRSQLARWINVDNIRNRGQAEINNSQFTTQQITNTLNFNKEVISDLNLNAVVGHEYLKYDFRGNGISAQDFPEVGLSYFNFLQYSTQTSRGVYSYASPTTELQSFFGRAIMNFRDKYLLTATMRADGSTKFGENNKYGYFPSLALAWNISNEDFLRGNGFLSNLKLRLGWGRTGNQEFPSGASLNRYVFGQQSISQTNFGNEDLQWETSTQTNAGVDFSVLRDRLTGSIDYFYKNTSDVLFEQTLVQPGPAGRIWINLPGNIINKGVEVSLNGGVLRQRDINWNVGVNASFLKNEVKNLLGFYQTGALHGQGISGATAQRLVSGQPLNVYYLRNFEGIDKSTGQSVYTDEGNTLFYSGSANPKMLLGLSTDFNYRKFTATINMNGAFGHFLYNNTANTVLPIGNLGTRNVAKSVIDAGVKEALSNPIAPSTRYLEKGNYMKLANATLSYNLGNIGANFRNATISLTGQNLFVLTDFTGFDPEVNTDKSIGGIPSLGIEYTPYPSARTILFGITFGF